MTPRLEPSPGTEDIRTYADFYDVFAGQKKLPQSNRKKLFALADTNSLVLTSVSDPSGSVLAAHAYVSDRGLRRVRLLYSASHFRNIEDSGERNLIGRANRFLHWFEITEFRKLDYLQYDLGGLPLTNTNPVLNAIAQFKLEFGGEQVIEYTGLVPGNSFGKLLLAVKRKVQ